MSVFRGLIVVIAGCLATTAAATTNPAPSEVSRALSQPRLAGEGTLRYFGFNIYDAKLWVGPGFDVKAFANYPIGLELTYNRSFSREAIAERSVKEIERQVTLTPEQASQWTQELSAWLPNVESGERLIGIYIPKQGMRLWHGDQLLGTIKNPDLARYFFGIWLSEKTSEPRLRRALLANLTEGSP